MNASLTYGSYLTSGIMRRELCLFLKRLTVDVSKCVIIFQDKTGTPIGYL